MKAIKKKKKKKKDKVDNIFRIVSKNNLEMPKENSITVKYLGGQNSKT